MERFALSWLREWKKKSNRKPLVLRGARQVGKSWLVREFGKREFENFVEINFERSPQFAHLFSSNDPIKIISSLEEAFNHPIEPGKTLLFLDEIQAAPLVFQGLRYFFEESPGLHIIAAGSLLELVLGEKEISVPVGRIEFLHLHPMSIEEVLLAKGKDRLVKNLQAWEPKDEISTSTHELLLSEIRNYAVVGGMPEVVQASLTTSRMSELDEIKHSILETYRDDFAKYRRRLDTDRLRVVFDSVPRNVGHRVKYVQLAPHFRAIETESFLTLLERARVIHRVFHSASNGVPLRAESDRKKFKVLSLDVGLQNTLLGLSLSSIESISDLNLVHSGAIAEQFVGQELIASLPFFQAPDLYFWEREKGGSMAEVDYVISVGTHIVPIEVKSGKTGRLRSLSQFVSEKKSRLALRVCSQPPSLSSFGGATLVSLPFYLVGQARRVLNLMNF